MLATLTECSVHNFYVKEANLHFNGLCASDICRWLAVNIGEYNKQSNQLLSTSRI